MRRKEVFIITKFARRYDRKTGKFIINAKYRCKTDVTLRTQEVAEAFGLGIDDEKQFVIYDNVELKIGPTDIALLTGDSGSGKSVLLRRIQKDLGKESDFWCVEPGMGVEPIYSGSAGRRLTARPPRRLLHTRKAS